MADRTGKLPQWPPARNYPHISPWEIHRSSQPNTSQNAQTLPAPASQPQALDVRFWRIDNQTTKSEPQLSDSAESVMQTAKCVCVVRFSRIGHTGGERSSMVDLTGGFGVTFRIWRADSAKLISCGTAAASGFGRTQYGRTGTPTARASCGDGVEYLRQMGPVGFHLLLIRPAATSMDRALRDRDCTPNVPELWTCCRQIAVHASSFSPMLDYAGRHRRDRTRSAYRGHRQRMQRNCCWLGQQMHEEIICAVRVFCVNDNQRIDSRFRRIYGSGLRHWRQPLPEVKTTCMSRMRRL